MADTRRKASSCPRGGQYCVAGNANGVGCTNGQHTKGVSLHTFPNKMRKKEINQQWMNIVRKHRPKWTSLRSSVLCSVHFDKKCFKTKLEIADALGMKRRLHETAVPTIDVADDTEIPVQPLTDRERRQVCFLNSGVVYCKM